MLKTFSKIRSGGSIILDRKSGTFIKIKVLFVFSKGSRFGRKELVLVGLGYTLVILNYITLLLIKY
jgi:hypothetical protein